MRNKNTKSSHYSYALNPEYMILWSKKMAKTIQTLIKSNKGLGYPVLCYSGMSGINHVAYLSMALTTLKVKFGQMYVRKDGEYAHGMNIEQTSFMHRKRKILLIFVDDFISSGKTLKQTVRKVWQSVSNYSKTDKIFLATTPIASTCCVVLKELGQLISFEILKQIICSDSEEEREWKIITPKKPKS